MIQQTPQADEFKQQLRDSLQREILNSRAIKVVRHANVYSCGDRDEMVYFIESGQIKLLMLSSEGRECILAIHSAGDIFGELCLAGLGARLETATAMKPTMLKQIPCYQFFTRLSRESPCEGFVQYLAVRIADQQQVIALRFLDEMSHEEAAVILEKTVEATRALQYRALTTLRHLLRKEELDAN